MQETPHGPAQLDLPEIAAANYAPARFPVLKEEAQALHEYHPVGLGDLVAGDHEFEPFDITDEVIAEASNTTLFGSYKDESWDDFTAMMMQASCAFFAQEVLTGPAEHPYNGKFLISEHHEEWDDLIAENDRLCVLAPRDHGKCQRGDALILTPSGRRVRIDEWEGGDLWAYDSKTHRFVVTHAPASRPNGVKRVLRVTTRSGRRVEVTENHPLRLWDRWKRADELQVGDRIGVPYRTPSQATGYLPDAWMIGLLVGDGGLTGSNTVLSCADEDVLTHVRSLYDVRHAEGVSYRVLGLRPRMRELGLAGKTAHTKRVPAAVFEAHNDFVAEFLAGYLDADAHVNFWGGGSVEFYSVSELLLRDVQHLLSRLGVLAVLSPKLGKYQGEDHHSWRLTVRGKDLITLADRVHPRGARRLALADLVEFQKSRCVASGGCVDRFPESVWGLLQHSEDWFRRNGHTRPSAGYQPTRAKVARVAEAENNTELLALANADVLWDEVVAIDDLGEDETWSIHVPEYVNYLADDVINHNTFFFDFAYPIWQAYFHPRGKGFIFSSTAPQAQRILQDIREEVENNPKLQWLVPDRKDIWSNTQLRFSNGHTIYARGFGTRVRGAHPNWIVVDDGLNDETAYSELVRTKQVDYFYTAITNMCVPGGQIIVVGTPFHQADLYADLADNPEYTFRQYQALNERTGIALWPDRYDLERLQKRQREIGTIRFQREFQCVPIADEMSLFPGWLFKGDKVELFNVTLGLPLDYWQRAGITSTFVGVDIALSAQTGADFFVVWCMGLDRWGNRYIIDIDRHKGLAYQEQLSHINAMARRYQAGLVYIEANQMQQIWGDELIRTTDLPIKKFVTTAQGKNALDKGVPSLRILFENGKFRIPRGDARSVELTDIWINEMRAFTWHEGKLQSVGTHDDTVMAVWICDQACRMGAFTFTFGGEDGMEMTQEELEAELGIDGKNGSGQDGAESGNGGASGSLVDDDIAHHNAAIPDPYGY